MSDPDWRRLPSLSALRAFEAVARLGGFSAAARSLNVTHAAVAQQVRGLEAELGLALVRREGRGLALTSEGRRLSEALGEGFRTISQGVEQLLRVESWRGLRVTTTTTFAQTVVMPRLARFWSAHPEVPISLVPSDALVDLSHERLDLAIRATSSATPASWPGYEAEVLLETQYVCYGAPSLCGAEGTPDYAALPWLLDPDDTREREWLVAAGLNPDKLKFVEIGFGPLAVLAGVNGYGVGFASDAVVRDEVTAGRLRVLPFPDLPRLTYWAVTPSGPTRPATRMFVDWLRAELGAAPTA